MTKIYRYFFLLLLFNIAALQSQTSRRDSLQLRLKSSTNKTERTDLLNFLAEISKKDDPKECLQYSYSALELAQSINYKKGIANAYNNLGNLYTNQDNYNKAYDFYSKSLGLRKEIDDKRGIAASLNNIAGLYNVQKDFKTALKHYEKSLDIRKELKDDRLVGASMNNIGSVYYRLGKLDKALAYFFESLAIKKKSGDKSLGYNYNNIANIYADLGQADTSLSYFFKAVESWKVEKDIPASAIGKLGISNMYYDKSDLENAEKFAKESLKESQQVHSIATISGAYGMLAQIYAEMGKFQEAYKAAEKMNAFQDTLFANSSLKVMRESEFRNDLEKRENAIVLLNKDKEIQKLQLSKNRTWIFVLVFGLVLIGVMLTVIMSRYKVKKRANILLTKKNIEIEEQKKDITDSINYAKRIQEAILPDKDIKYKAFPDAFVLFKPKDIVSGDFYWFTEKNGKRLIAAVDCTGHGVPGAFMSMIGNAFLNEIINEKGITKPSEILNQLSSNIIKSLKQTGIEGESKDGMDISILCFDEDEKGSFVEFAGANNPLWRFKKQDNSFTIEEIKADKQPIGFSGGKQASFTNHRVELASGDALYIFTDGYADQFGGPKTGQNDGSIGQGKKFKYKQLQDLLLSLQQKKMSEQEEELLKAFNEWKGNLEQVDDVCVIGIRI
ncbi:MAG: tetratricopeptide repeat protein [Bacteroidetes bacterium]|nr:tetratricopeptide repeat protein [Bacteroidota bacterium]